MTVEDYGWKSGAASGSSAYLYGPILTLIGETRPRSILDLGCGNGHLAKMLSSKGYRVAAADVDRKGIELARQDSASVDFRCVDMSDKPPDEWTKSPFDCIISTEVVEHMFFPRHLFQFATACLVAGGRLHVSTPYHGWLKNVIISATGGWDKHHQPDHEGGHIKFWSRATLGRLAASSGFREVKFTGCGRYSFLWKSMLITYQS